LASLYVGPRAPRIEEAVIAARVAKGHSSRQWKEAIATILEELRQMLPSLALDAFRRVPWTQLTLEDLDQVAVAELLMQLPKFKPNRTGPTKSLFLLFVTTCVQRALFAAVRQAGPAVHVPHNHWKRLSKARKARRRACRWPR
jgi:hypothetical protein